jgi:Ca-activated chloride channel family protein
VTRSLSAALAAAALLLPARLPGAVAAQKAPVFQAGVEMVNVTVTARDAKGRLVSNLTQDDFVLKEDGRPQQLQLFAAAAPQMHTGDRAERAAELHCTRCTAVLRVAEGETVPRCPEGHTTFDVGSQKELALNLGMLFDTSESMRKEIKLSQESAIRFLDAIPRAKDLLLEFFDRDIRISRYNSENQQGIFERILQTEGSGFTALNDAIAVYLSRISDTPGRKVLVLFSDGDDTTSRLTGAEIEQILRASDVVVYPVAFAGERPNSSEGMRARAFLASLAEASGGRVFSPHASRELAAIYQTILDELGSQYVIGYVSDNPASDGRFRKLLLDVRRPGIKLRYRPGYAVPKDESRSTRR